MVLVYAYFGGLGIADLEKGLNKGKGKMIPGAVIALAIVTPFVYSYTMLFGFNGRLKSVDYPKDYYEIDDFLNRDPDEFNILFLPWHGYMDFRWIPNSDKRIANPATSFFGKPVIQGDTVEAGGVYTQSTNPTSKYIEFLLRNKGDITNFGELIAPLNVKYVILAKEADYENYFFLFNQNDLELVKETQNLYLFKNKHEVAKIYEVDGVSVIKDWGELLEMSEDRDINDQVYVMGDTSEIDTKSAGRRLLEYEKKSPVRYEVEERPTKGYLIFTNAYSDAWGLGNKRPIKNLGVTNAFEVEGVESATIEYTRFEIYLAGYIISSLTFAGLVYAYLKAK